MRQSSWSRHRFSSSTSSVGSCATSRKVRQSWSLGKSSSLTSVSHVQASSTKAPSLKLKSALLKRHSRRSKCWLTSGTPSASSNRCHHSNRQAAHSPSIWCELALTWPAPSSPIWSSYSSGIEIPKRQVKINQVAAGAAEDTAKILQADTVEVMESSAQSCKPTQHMLKISIVAINTIMEATGRPHIWIY